VDSTANRLELTGPEWVVLCRVAGITAPDGFSPVDEVSDEDLATAEAALAERGLLGGDDKADLHPWLGIALTIWVAPDVVVQVEAAIRELGARAVYVLQGPLAGSLASRPDGGVRLATFPAVELGAELRHAVPEIPTDTVGRSTMNRLVPGAGPARLQGRLPLVALTDGTSPGYLAGAAGAGGPTVSQADALLAAELQARTIGVLSCLVTGSIDPQTRVGLVGNLVWYATDAGWIGMRPHPDGSGRQLVDLVPVDRTELAAWLAPYLTRVLEAVNG
jgi:hypothetical protein